MPFVKRFEQIEHTADKGAIAYGGDIPQLFENGALSMVSLMCDPSDYQPTEFRDVFLEAADVETLFVRWLSELVYLLDVNGLLAVEFALGPVTPCSLKARVGFALVDRDSFEQRGAIVKAITYHGLDIHENGAGWSATYYVDV